MTKIASRLFDLYDDENLSIIRRYASSLSDVKVASHDEIQQLEDKHFGLVLKTAAGAVLRRYPIHDADATRLSRIYFDELRETLPDEIAASVQAKIAAAEVVHGLSDTMPKEQAKDMYELVSYIDAGKIAEVREPTAFFDECWGLIVDGKRCFPLHTSELVKEAEKRFPAACADLEPHERFLLARAIEKRAQELNAVLPENSPIHRYTNPELNLDALKLALDARRPLIKAAGLSTDVVDALAYSAGCIPERGELEDDTRWNARLQKWASAPRMPVEKIIFTLIGIDKLAGISRQHYNSGLPDPYAACFKRAAHDNPTVVDGVDVSKISLDAMRAMFDESFIREFYNNPAAVYRSLPDPIRNALRALAEQGNRTPAAAGGSSAPAPSRSGGDPRDVLAARYSNGGSVGF